MRSAQKSVRAAEMRSGDVLVQYPDYRPNNEHARCETSSEFRLRAARGLTQQLEFRHERDELQRVTPRTHTDWVELNAVTNTKGHLAVKARHVVLSLGAETKCLLYSRTHETEY
jgi:hypothetical protein